MQVNGNGHEEQLDGMKVKFVSFLSFLFGFTDAFFVYVASTYFARVLGSDNVGAFYFITFAVVFGFLWFLHRFIRKLGGSVRSFFLLVLVAIISSAVISSIPVGWVGAILVALLLASTNVAWVVLDVVLEEFSADGVTGTVRGLHLTIMNAGLLLAPFASAKVLETYDFEGVFFGVTLGYSVLLAAAIILLRNGVRFSSAKLEVRSAWRKMLESKDLFHIYHVSFALEFFYVIMIIYTPIYLRSLGISWEEIGALFTVMLLPFVIFQYPLGVLADRRYGEKEFLIVSLGLSAVATLAIGLFASSSLFFWGALLFLSRVGAAGIEVLRDAYFYKQVDARDDDLIAFFRTARPAANIVGAALAVPMLWLFPLQSVFFLATIVIVSALFSTLSINDTPAEAELARR